VTLYMHRIQVVERSKELFVQPWVELMQQGSDSDSEDSFYSDDSGARNDGKDPGEGIGAHAQVRCTKHRTTCFTAPLKTQTPTCLRLHMRGRRLFAV
jgi:hypothetical protein